jgi:hypothetical protein
MGVRFFSVLQLTQFAYCVSLICLIKLKYHKFHSEEQLQKQVNHDGEKSCLNQI